jgi:2-amino-4-hydroxy-6-hydroxymethyldihydropteridine diphosphokinase
MTKKNKIVCLPGGYRRGGVVRQRRGMILYHLGLGSNLGDRGVHIENAVDFLMSCGRVLKRSSVYETAPLGMPGAGLFLNMVLALESPLAPLALLAKCKEYEASQGRDLQDSHYRDRAIDIDILLAGDLVLATPELTVPHPRLAERGFVLVPLFEIAPKLIHPLAKVSVAHLLSHLHSGEKIKSFEDSHERSRHY